ncbi:hypothetical protein Desaci_0574 [Desulfosporosinus acidiphilus SJ4]|uniref:Thioredoxin domain-containing protein n=1 Tax=Desulfosporosinus acidiphilus (strain DSM 22704 / JCM 16185 / SJ4) TaxID=646529 RepID=I4D1G4_DESAJ|nr:hypothetical protein [Desulfosporosinus acidiphilus]AFM39638.1 hypothetical protein Desaci_0574 [Desulfosporosinus acidiphilus SJ4]
MFIVSVLMFPAAALAAPVKVEALGFFDHPPLQPTKDAIQKVCQEFGDQVQLVFHVENTADGNKFMKDNGLSGHLPVVLYIDGSVAQNINGKTVVFRDFEGQGWTSQDLEQVLKLNVAGQKTAVSPPANALTEAWNPGAIPPGAAAFANGQSPGADNSSTGNQSSLFPIYLMGAIILLLVIIIIISVVRRPAAGRK